MQDTTHGVKRDRIRNLAAMSLKYGNPMHPCLYCIYATQ